jgi:hypothetical protein
MEKKQKNGAAHGGNGMSNYKCPKCNHDLTGPITEDKHVPTAAGIRSEI